MYRKVVYLITALAIGLLAAAPVAADAGKPDFSGGLYADGRLWGTKGAATIPAPLDSNVQSYDKLFVVVNGVGGQLPVAEAAPGNPMYNGGRWFTHTVTWDAGATPVLLTSYADIMAHASELTIMAGSPPGGPALYFECPLLPVK